MDKVKRIFEQNTTNSRLKYPFQKSKWLFQCQKQVFLPIYLKIQVILVEITKKHKNTSKIIWKFNPQSLGYFSVKTSIFSWIINEPIKKSNIVTGFSTHFLKTPFEMSQFIIKIKHNEKCQQCWIFILYAKHTRELKIERKMMDGASFRSHTRLTIRYFFYCYARDITVCKWKNVHTACCESRTSIFWTEQKRVVERARCIPTMLNGR